MSKVYAGTSLMGCIRKHNTRAKRTDLFEKLLQFFKTALEALDIAAIGAIYEHTIPDSIVC